MSLGNYIGAGSGTTRLLLHMESTTPTDDSGNSHSASRTGCTVVAGRFGNGYNFANGSSGTANYYVSVPNNAMFSPGTGDFTEVVWFKTSDTRAASNVRLIMKYHNTIANGAWEIRYGTDFKLTATMYDTTLAHNLNVTSNVVINDGLWHNVIYVKSGTTGTLYLDGSYNGSKTDTNMGTVNTDSAASYLWVGCYSNTTSPQNAVNGYNGVMDEVIVETRAWTAMEIKKYYTMCRGRFGI